MSAIQPDPRRGDWPRLIAALVFLALLLLLPDIAEAVRPRAFFRLPMELPLSLLLPLLLPPVVLRPAQVLLSIALAALVAVKIACMVTYMGFDRPFDPLVDVLLVSTALDTLRRANILFAVGAVLGAVLVFAATISGVMWANGVLTRKAMSSPRAVLALAALLAVFSPVVAAPLVGEPPYRLAGAETTDLLRAQVQSIRNGLADLRQFDAEVKVDPSRPGNAFDALRGNDVLVIFVESYGRTAVENPDSKVRIVPALREIETILGEKSFTARSAWLTSPTFGGESWLAHSTLASGLWISHQRRYNTLIDSGHSTLVGDFRQAGWRTVGVMPEITMDWPDAAFYGFDTFYGARDLGYAGPPFGYITMPDQFAMAAFNHLELAKPDRAPLMAQIALVSSHIPWMPIPKFVPWSDVADGRIFATERIAGDWGDVWNQYGMTVEYVLRTLSSFIATHVERDALIIILGDHQPMDFITGSYSGHDVPVHIIARDEKALEKLGADWTRGMVPDDASPTWRMDEMRSRMLNAFTTRADDR